MGKDYTIYIQHALDAIELIQKATEGFSAEDLKHDPIIASSVMYQLIIIGEVVSRLPDEFLVEFTEIPWKQIKAARNRIVHDYYSVDVEILWVIISRDLPKLKSTLEIIKTQWVKP